MAAHADSTASNRCRLEALAALLGKDAANLPARRCVYVWADRVYLQAGMDADAAWVFATVRHRTARTKGALSAKTAKLMVVKLVTAAVKGENQLPKVVEGVRFQYGIEFQSGIGVVEMPAHRAA